MTLHYNGKKRFIECDHCPETTDEFDKDDFDILIATAREQGWDIRPGRDGYDHKCPGCKADRVGAQRRLLGL